MSKGFTIKELVFAIFIIIAVILIIKPIISNNVYKMQKENLLNQAKIYIEQINTAIITANSNNEKVVYDTYIPNIIGETSTFNIENISDNYDITYKGIIKVSYQGNSSYIYKIAINDSVHMIGTVKNLVEQEQLSIDLIKKFDGSFFYDE